MSEWFDPDSRDSLDNLMGGIVDEYDTARTNYWAGEEDDPDYERYTQITRFADGLAGLLLGDVESLARAYDLVAWDAILTDLKARGLLIDLEHALQIKLARKYASTSRLKSERSVELATVVVRATPDPVILEYLARLSRCYILDLRAETVILCRAVLENAVKRKYDRVGVSPPKDRQGRVTMASRLQGAVDHGWIGERVRGDCQAIWLRGSKAVHNDPDAVKDVLGTLTMTMTAVETLCV
jgi:hypothetical protein